MRFAWGSATDVGRVRTNNQDSLFTAPAVWAVADGMGGHRGGEVASSVAIDVFSTSYGDSSIEGLVEAAQLANDAVYQQASDDPDLRGMGTTLVAIAPVDEDGHTTLAWVNIGDSRLYRFRQGELEQISEDHSLVEEMVRDGRISADEARTHPQRNILTRALGIDANAAIDASTIDPYEGDRYLLCSDGLFNEVDEARIASTLRRLDDPTEAAQELVRLALEGGGRDNITVVIVDVVDDDDAAGRASAAVGAGTAEGVARDEERDDTMAAPVAAAAAPAADSRRARRAERRAEHPRRVTFRVLLFLVVLVALIGGALFAVTRIARGGYTVRQAGTNVVIYEGNGERVLWLAPSVQQDLGPITVVDRFKQAVTKGQHFDTLEEAKAFATQITTNQPTPSTTTTTTSTSTTIAPTTTVAPPP